jgi:hypothetical protein
LRKRRSDGNTDYFGPVEIEETSIVDLCLCFLSLRRVESGEWRGRGEEARVDGLWVIWYGGGLSGGRRGRGARGRDDRWL